ncbi:MAG: HDIG domain-containing protein [Proteobacteria bacterium]|nr:HDIG domain-containing protein [Pseudomonadota bacterium]
MQNGKGKPSTYLKYGKFAIFLVLSIVLSLIISIKSQYGITEYQYGDIARENIKSPVDTYIPKLDITIKKGEIIIREGERVGEDHLNKLYAFKNLEKEKPSNLAKIFYLSLLLFLFMVIIYEYADRNIKKFALSEKDLIFGAVLLIFTTAMVKLPFFVFEYFTQKYAPDIFYIVPIFLFGIIMRVALFSEAAIVFSIFFAIIMGFAFENSMPIFLYTFIGNVLASYFSGKCENRNTILKAGLYTAFIMSFIMLLFNLITGHALSNLPARIAFILLSGIGSSFIALGLLPVIEHIFDYTTDVKLLELANLEHPLLEDMMVNAPGTYHHSIIVGNLSKAAAESIEAHPLLTRVSSYYHDIGKLKMSHYFIENQKGFEDAHKTLSPNMSALIILSHVKEGVELAEKYRLGKKIKDIIKEHHGTSLVSYFYNRAKEMEDPELHIIEKQDFRYAGPKPQTKEAGIVMLADSVEASSRMLADPTPKRIENHVQNVIENIFLDGQLDDCELTLKDLHAIQKSFITILLGIFHHRIEYPEKAEHDDTHKRLTKVSENGQKAHKKDHGRPVDIFKAAG